MKKLIIIAVIMFLSVTIYATGKRDYYLIQIYHCSNQQQIENIDVYLKNIYLPYLHNKGIKKVGVFAPISNDTALDKQLYVWIPLKNIQQLDQLDQDIEQINPMGNEPLINLASNDGSKPYNRIEKIVSKAFKNAPNYQTKSDLIKSSDQIFEYRSYESETENLHLRKVHMFNEGNEIGIFQNNHFNAIFYSKVIAGARMPNLIYMTSFNNMKERNEHWKAFVADPATTKVFNLPEYQKAVSATDIILMKARDYADF